ncbi:MAG: ParM/StbA family protein [Burkholderiales bacterium]|nr:ParM/StbA family protein [Burkholderiales bacterium]
MSELKVAVDVGSGMTKIADGELRLMVPSVVGAFSENYRGFLANPEVLEVRASRLVRNGRYIFGKQAEALIPPDQRAATLSSDWPGSDAWGALLLAAVTRVCPDGFVGQVDLATGVPQALYSTRRDDIAARIDGVHEFQLGSARYEIHVRPQVLPQAAAAILADDGLARLVGAHGVIDPGTFTTGMAVVCRRSEQEEFAVQYWRCGGIEVGVSRMVGILSEEISRRFGGQMEPGILHTALRERRLSIRGEVLDISEMVDYATSTVAAQIVESVSKLWPNGAMDLDSISIVGGGAALLAHPIQQAFKQASVAPEAQWSVVNGLHRYLASLQAA